MSTVEAIVTSIAGVLTILTIMWAFGRKLWRRIGEFLDDWQGTPGRAGVPAKPGVMERLGTIETRLYNVEHEVRPDHGRSMHDKVNRIEQVITGDGSTNEARSTDRRDE